MKSNLIVLGFSFLSMLGYSQNNTFNGNQAGNSNTTGNGNTFTGAGAGKANTTGSTNTFTGAFSGFRNTTGNQNTFIGLVTGQFNTTGSNNVFLGSGAGSQNSSGNENTYVGILAGSKANGSRNVFIGRQAGQNETGSNKLYIGNSATSNPLIYGEFNTSKLKINGSIEITGNITNSGFQSSVSNIAANTAKIANNTSLINANNLLITNSNSAIDTNTSVIAVNTAAINNNASNIEFNSSLSDSNKSAIVINSNDIEANTSDISDNAEAIVANTTVINQLNTDVNMDATNVIVGAGANTNESPGERNAFYGANAGANNRGNGNVFIGYDAGKNEEKSNKLYISNSATARPLVKGDFSSKKVVIHGDLTVFGRIRSRRSPLAKGLNEDNQIASDEIARLQSENIKIRAELQEIKALIAEIMEQKSSIEANTSDKKVVSLFNMPNPFTSSTTIKYTLPPNTKSAEIRIYDIQGRLIQSYSGLKNKDEIIFDDNNNTMSEIYICKLIVNGREVASKKLLSKN